jgi:hypothetical protein
MEYLDFELGIERGEGGTYPVAVLHSPCGKPDGTLRLPFDQQELGTQIVALEGALSLSGVTAERRGRTMEAAPVYGLGRALFEALLAGDVLTCYDASKQQAAEQHKGLRLKLRLQAPELAALPWEFLFDPRDEQYLGLSLQTPLVRYVETQHPIAPLQVTPPLRILGMIASPTDLPPLDVATEKRRLERALRQLGGLVSLTWLPGQTWEALQEHMLSGPWNVFHFVGHGGFDPAADEGLLALADEAGAQHLLTATQVGHLLADHQTLRLVVLNACEGARGGIRDVFSSTAATLVRRGIPAVLAMQYRISDQAAIQCSERFYSALAHGQPVDAAVAAARIGMSMATHESAEWGTPVLYMQAPDGMLFDVAALRRARLANKLDACGKRFEAHYLRSANKLLEADPEGWSKAFFDDPKGGLALALADYVKDVQQAAQGEADLLNLGLQLPPFIPCRPNKVGASVPVSKLELSQGGVGLGFLAALRYLSMPWVSLPIALAFPIGNWLAHEFVKGRFKQKALTAIQEGAPQAVSLLRQEAEKYLDEVERLIDERRSVEAEAIVTARPTGRRSSRRR